MRPFPWPSLPNGFSDEKERALKQYLSALLRWHGSLAAWPEPPSDVPDAMPIVTVYGKGETRGCFGSTDGVAKQRAARAFLKAVHDDRFAPITAADRQHLAASLSYLDATELIELDAITESLEPATHGLAIVPASGSAVLLNPSVAIEHRLDARGMLNALARKAGRLGSGKGEPDWRRDDAFYLFTTRDIVARSDDVERDHELSPTQSAVRFVESMILGDGAVQFSCDVRNNDRISIGPMHHGRVAVALTGLAQHRPGSPALQRARERLQRDIEAALAGESVSGWPDSAEQVAGTVALAMLAGLSLEARLLELASDCQFTSSWHCAQVVTALGTKAPRSLIDRALVDDEPWSPWSLTACLAAGEHDGAQRRTATLLAQIRSRAPYLGGVGEPIAELARTAATIEALQRLPSSGPLEEALTSARAFLLRWQRRHSAQAWVTPEADGAFPIAPNHTVSQLDTVGHVLCAL